MATPQVHSSATATFQHTETQLSWMHTDGVAGSGSAIIAFIGALDSQITSATAASFSGSIIQGMSLIGELTGPGNAFPSIHAFLLNAPPFTGGEGRISVTMAQNTTNLAAMSVCVTGLNTTEGSLLNTPAFAQETFLRAGGAIIGTISGNTGNLLMDCVVAQAGSPDTHTPGTNQTLVSSPAALNVNNSAKLSVSFKTALNNGFQEMSREEVTPLNTVSQMLIVLKGF